MSKLRDQLKRQEGTVPYAYQDSSGYWSIATGRLIDKRKGGRLREDEMDLMLDNDIADTQVDVVARWPWVRGLNAARQDVLFNMAFNLGVAGLAGFRNTLEAVRTQRWDDAAKGMLASKWAKQVGARATELAAQMREGEYQ